jgi:hypothetical protein
VASPLMAIITVMPANSTAAAGDDGVPASRQTPRTSRYPV